AQARLWEGGGGASANLGAMLVTDRGGTRRFVHEIASLFALERRLAEAGVSLDAATSGESPTGTAVLDGWIEDASLALAETIVNTATMMELEFGFLEAALPDPVIERLVAATVRQMERVPNIGQPRPQLRVGHVGGGAAARGAAELRLYRRWFSRDLEF